MLYIVIYYQQIHSESMHIYFTFEVKYKAVNSLLMIGRPAKTQCNGTLLLLVT